MSRYMSFRSARATRPAATGTSSRMVATLTVAREHDDEGLGGWHELAPDVAAALGIEVRHG